MTGMTGMSPQCAVRMHPCPELTHLVTTPAMSGWGADGSTTSLCTMWYIGGWTRGSDNWEG